MAARKLTRRLITAAAVAAGGSFLLLYALVDPQGEHFPLRCPMRMLTGLQCPGCGSQRMLHALLTGHPLDAWLYNPFLCTLIPLLIFMLWVELNRTKRPTLYKRVHHPLLGITLGVAITLWTVARNVIGI